ncbi:MAG: FHA domain-containing protein [bacterium]
MYAKLFCKTGALAGTSHRFSTETTIGKSKNNKLSLTPETISGQHARIYWDEEDKRYYLEDLNSRNGTRLDGMRVRQKERLSRLHIITLARQHDFIFQVVDGELEDEKPGADTVFDQEAIFAPPEVEQQVKPEEKHDITHIDEDIVAVPDLPGVEKSTAEEGPKAAPGLVIEIKSSGRTFPLEEGENVVGRGKECDVFVDDDSISRKHAVLRLQQGKVWVQDLQSKNQTFVAEEKVDSEREVEVGAEIKFGVVECRLRRASG